mmetsp:Transcript_45699/g.148550  ORF Transcript_45699/g.148550 Transcript_45699/m.148550 type:complete len:247 (-) Transcript_45699:442-1182(-)
MRPPRARTTSPPSTRLLLSLWRTSLSASWRRGSAGTRRRRGSTRKARPRSSQTAAWAPCSSGSLGRAWSSGAVGRCRRAGCMSGPAGTTRRTPASSASGRGSPRSSAIQRRRVPSSRACSRCGPRRPPTRGARRRRSRCARATSPRRASSSCAGSLSSSAGCGRGTTPPPRPWSLSFTPGQCASGSTAQPPTRARSSDAPSCSLPRHARGSSFGARGSRRRAARQARTTWRGTTTRAPSTRRRLTR